MTRPTLLCLMLILSSFLVMANEKNQFFGFVESLEKNNLTQEAVTEYQRYLFFNHNLNDPEKGKIWLRLAICYRKLNQEARMMNAFGRAYEFLRNSPLIENVNEEISIFFLSRGKAELARVFLNKLKPEMEEQKINAYFCLSYLMEKDWELFFKALNKTELTQNMIKIIHGLVKKIKRNDRRYKLYRTINIFFPGIVYSFYGDLLRSGESFLFHFYFLEQIFSNSNIISKVINSLAVTRMYLKTRQLDKEFLRKMSMQKNIRLEGEIFTILFDWE